MHHKQILQQRGKHVNILTVIALKIPQAATSDSVGQSVWYELWIQLIRTWWSIFSFPMNYNLNFQNALILSLKPLKESGMDQFC